MGLPNEAQLDNQTKQNLAAMPSTTRGEARVQRVPLIRASTESLRGYGRLVRSFDEAHVDIVPWPTSGRRPLVPGTGLGGGTVRGGFDMQRRGGILFATNHAVRRRYITGWYGDPATTNEAS